MNTTITLQDSFLSERTFYDDKNYPRGISRSGEYSIAEVQIIEKYGHALFALSSGVREPVTEEEQKFVCACNGLRAPSTKIEKAWLKYQSKVLKEKKIYTLSSTKQIDIDDDVPLSTSSSIEELSEG